MCMNAATCIDELLDEIMAPKMKKTETKSFDKLSVEENIMLLEDEVSMVDDEIEYCISKLNKYQAELENLERRRMSLKKQIEEYKAL